jgi:HEAT repeat protein
LERVLGRGAFGTVYLARDEELQRRVAVKVPHRVVGSDDKHLQDYLREAQVLASLEHPGIVPVYDIGRTDDGLCYIVSKLVPGRTLADVLQSGRLSLHEAVAIVAQVAEALDYAHSRQVVHRDIKPSNLLLDRQGRVFVSDFGLALTKKAGEAAGEVAGTIPYMSPEQARGDTDRIDGRSDVFSLGIVFFELLTGSRPFRGKTADEVIDQVLHADPPDSFALGNKTPKELVKICLKCLEKQPSRRFTSAMQMARALRHWQTTTAAPPKLDRMALRIVPERFQPFAAADTDLYRDLQFGDQGGASLPDPLVYWTSWVQGANGRQPISGRRIGLVCGPAGSGKSSFIRAGLLPCLGQEVPAVYVATGAGTEAALRNGFRHLNPALPEEVPLADAIRRLQHGPLPKGATKILIVLDQFERWMAAHAVPGKTELATALDCCDGERVQALVVVREEFHDLAEKFLHDLGVKLDAAINRAVVDNFDVAQAERLLIRIGQAWCCLPAKLANISPAQANMVGSYVSSLSYGGKVSPLRMAQVARTLRPWPWGPVTMSQIGGVRGALVDYADECLRGRASDRQDPERYFRIARALVEALVPPLTFSVRHHACSLRQLRESAAAAAEGREIAELLALLEQEMRFVVRVPPGAFADADEGAAQTPWFRLESNEVADVLREWLARKAPRKHPTTGSHKRAGKGKKRNSEPAGEGNEGTEQPAPRWHMILHALSYPGAIALGASSALFCLRLPPLLVVVTAGLGLVAGLLHWLKWGELKVRWLLFLGAALVATLNLQPYPDQLRPAHDAVAWMTGKSGARLNRTQPPAPVAPVHRPPLPLPDDLLYPLEQPLGQGRRLQKQLDERNAFIRSSLPKVLEQHPEVTGRAVVQLTAILVNPCLGDPAEAARALGEIHSPQAVEALSLALKESPPPVWGEALKALRRSDPEAEALAVPVLVAHLPDKAIEAQVRAAELLGEIGAARSAIGPLQELLGQPRLESRRAAFTALLRIDRGAAVACVPRLVENLRDTSVLREQAADCLAQLGPDAREAVQPLLRCYADSADAFMPVRQSIFRALVAIDRGAAARLEPDLLRVLGDRDAKPAARREAAEFLGKLGPLTGPAAAKALLEAVDDPVNDVAGAAFAAVRAINPALLVSVVPSLVRRLGDHDPKRREQAAGFIDQLPDDARILTVAPLIEAMNSRDSGRRAEAFRALSKMPAGVLATRVPKLIETLRFKPETAHLAAKLLGGLGPAAKDAVPALVANLGDPDARVSNAARRALAEIGEPAVPALLEALRRSKNPPSAKVPPMRSARPKVWWHKRSRYSSRP